MNHTRANDELLKKRLADVWEAMHKINFKIDAMGIKNLCLEFRIAQIEQMFFTKKNYINQLINQVAYYSTTNYKLSRGFEEGLRNELRIYTRRFHEAMLALDFKINVNNSEISDLMKILELYQKTATEIENNIVGNNQKSKTIEEQIRQLEMQIEKNKETLENINEDIGHTQREINDFHNINDAI